jgi:hypothetical protein
LLTSTDKTVSLALIDGRIVALRKSQVDGVIRHSAVAKLKDKVKSVLGGLKPVITSMASRAQEVSQSDDDFDTPVEKGIHPGELERAAHLSPKGVFIVHGLSGMSSFRIHDLLDVRTNGLRWLAGPNGAMKVKLSESATSALAVEPVLWRSWDESSHSYGVNLRYSSKFGGGWLHLSAGFFDERLHASFDWDGGSVTWPHVIRALQLGSLNGRFDEEDSELYLYGTRIPFGFDIDWHLDEGTLLQTGLHTTTDDLVGDTGHNFTANAIYVSTVGSRGRIGIGVVVLGGEYIPDYKDSDLDDAADELEKKLNAPTVPISPIPWFEFWVAL